MINVPGAAHGITADIGNQTKIYMHEGEVTVTVATTNACVIWVGRHGAEQLPRDDHDSIQDTAYAWELHPW
jgi:hypothetical protein